MTKPISHQSYLKMLMMLFGLSVGLNYVWELAQSPLYTGVPTGVSVWWHCFVASIGDGVMIVIIQLFGWLRFGRIDWFGSPGKKEYALMLGTGLILALAVEIVAIHAHRWSYAPDMPLVPGLRIGLVPLAQMLVLPPIAFWLTARSVQRRT